MNTRTWTDHLAIGLLLTAFVGLLSVPLWPDSERTASRKADEKIERLEKKADRALDRANSAEAKVTNLEVVLDELVRKVSRLEPEEAVWLSLERGTGHKWLFDTGDEAQVEFLELTEDRTGGTFRIVHKTLDTSVTLRPGETLEGVDDRGTERRVYRTTLHAIRKDRSGQPRTALISVAMSVESGL
jgi:hypothetical protein